MNKQVIETYPTYDGLGDIVSETKAWYRAMGLQIGGSLYSVIKASEGITGLVHSIAKTLGGQGISAKVHISVEDTPSIAYVTTTRESGTVVHVGAWLYNREQLEQWHPNAKKLNDSDMLVFVLGLINGAVALDMIAGATRGQRENSINDAIANINGAYNKRIKSGFVRAIEQKQEEEQTVCTGVSEKYVYISAAIHDMLAIKTCLTEYGNASWIIFPLLLFREFFDDEFADFAKTLIEQNDTLDNLVACVSSLRCFSRHSAQILNVNTSVGINIIKALLAGTNNNISENSDTARNAISSEMLAAYIAEIRQEQEKQEQQKQPDSQEQQDKHVKDGSQQKLEEKHSKDDSQQKHQSGLVKNIEPQDASTPINDALAKEKNKTYKQFLKENKFNEDAKADNEEAARVWDYYQARLSKNKQERHVNAPDNKSLTEEFMRLMFNGKIRFKNKKLSNIPAPLVFKNISEYVKYMREICGGIYDTYYSSEEFKNNILFVYNSVDKQSLKNLFLERTMDIEKSQPARSGITLISTRIANIFTDEKIFSPLPESETERDSEVIILVDASGSMYSHHVKVMDNNGKQKYMSLYEGVVGAAYAIAEGLQRANVSCSVFAHSTTPDPEKVFVCKLNDQYSINTLNDFASAHMIQNANNGDSYALDMMEQFFNLDGRDVGRTLIVLSDGQPAFNGYEATADGDIMTKESANRLRDIGIKVYSISLIESVVSDNDRIYGAEYNFFPTDTDKESMYYSSHVMSVSSMLKKIVEIVSKNSPRSADNVLTQG